MQVCNNAPKKGETDDCRSNEEGYTQKGLGNTTKSRAIVDSLGNHSLLQREANRASPLIPDVWLLPSGHSSLTR
jgi:hypothetical protein